MKMHSTLEDTFISDLIKAKKPVSIYLQNGIRLKGIIIQSKESVLFLQHEFVQTIFKHRISAIEPSSCV